jgi:hypothetical protein
MEIERVGSQPSGKAQIDGKTVNWLEPVTDDQYRAGSQGS